MFSCSEIIAQASDALAHLNIPHTLQNTLQAKFPSYNETLSYKIHVHSSSTFHAIMEALSTFGFIKSFNFTAILAAFFGSTLSSTFNFTSLQKLDPIPLIEIFEHCNIPYSQTHNTLIFIATPSNIEEAILAALDLSISIPPSFLSSAKRLLLNILMNLSQSVSYSSVSPVSSNFRSPECISVLHRVSSLNHLSLIFSKEDFI